MRKIPTLFNRAPDNPRDILRTVHPDCDWVLAGRRPPPGNGTAPASASTPPAPGGHGAKSSPGRLRRPATSSSLARLLHR